MLLLEINYYQYSSSVTSCETDVNEYFRFGRENLFHLHSARFTMSQQSAFQYSSASSADFRKEAATKRDNNGIDAEIRQLVDLWGNDRVQSDLEWTGRNIVV